MAAPSSAAIFWPSSTTTPPTSTGAVAVRSNSWRAESKRSISSTVRAGSRASGRSPRASSATRPLPNTLTDASWPAFSRSTTAATSSSSLSPAASRSVVRSSAGSVRRRSRCSRTWPANSRAAVTAASTTSGEGAGSYIRTIACDQLRRTGTSAPESPISSAMTRTGSGSAYSPMTSKPAGSTPSRSEAARDCTRGRSRSTCPRLKALATARRNRVCCGGSFSIIWLRWSRLNGSRYAAGSRSRQIRPSRRSRSTAPAAACENVSQLPLGSCQATSCRLRSRAKCG